MWAGRANAEGALWEVRYNSTRCAAAVCCWRTDMPPSSAARSSRSAHGWDELGFQLAGELSVRIRLEKPGRAFMQAPLMQKVVRPCISAFTAFCTFASVAASSALVASSRIRIGGSFSSARAMAMPSPARCLSRSNHRVSPGRSSHAREPDA